MPDFKINELKCLTFEMTYTFLTDGVPDEDFGCDSSQLLPSNLDAASTYCSHPLTSQLPCPYINVCLFPRPNPL